MLLAADGDVDYVGLFKWSFVLIVLVLILWVAVSTLRKRLKEDDVVGTGFTLSDLRQLHKQGKMSTEEFEKAKAILLASLAKDVSPPTTEPKPPTDPQNS
jgi:HJR/Mrr/RecB family endonuclease